MKTTRISAIGVAVACILLGSCVTTIGQADVRAGNATIPAQAAKEHGCKAGVSWLRMAGTNADNREYSVDYCTEVGFTWDPEESEYFLSFKADQEELTFTLRPDDEQGTYQVFFGMITPGGVVLAVTDTDPNETPMNFAVAFDRGTKMVHLKYTGMIYNAGTVDGGMPAQTFYMPTTLDLFAAFDERR